MEWSSLVELLPTVIAAFCAGAVCTWLARLLALRTGILDYPKEPRKTHREPMPLLGGLGIWVAVALVVSMTQTLTPSLWAFLIAGGVLMLVGAADDRWNIKPGLQILGPIIAALIMLAGDVGIQEVTNPLGGVLQVGWWQVVTFLWLLGMTYTVKLLDGVDGLAAGVSTVAFTMMALLALTTRFYQPEIAQLALILAGGTAGFLLWNAPPAKIYLGEGGSTFLGFSVGVVAIISGSKVMTALLVMGIPALDIAFVLMRRLMQGKPLAAGDRNHLHHRLLQKGLNASQTVLLLCVLAAAFGTAALFLQTREKIIALALLVALLLVLTLWTSPGKKAAV